MSRQDPDPRRTPGLEPGTGVPPGETPPGEGGTAGIAHQEARESPRWATRAVIAAIVLFVLLIAGFMVVRIVLTIAD